MKTVTLFIVLLFVGFLAHAKDEKPFMSKTFTASGITALNVKTSGGSISVAGQDGEARVEVYVKANGGNWFSDDTDRKEIEERLKEDYILSVKQEGSSLVCEARRKDENSMWNWKNGLSISFKIYVPKNITSNLRTSGGAISLKNLKGTQNFATSGGSMSLAGVDGDIKGHTSGGSINVSDCSGNKIMLSTSGGSIRANQCDGDIRLTTSGGSISIGDMKGALYASTSGGSIVADVQSLGKSLELSTSGGSISAKLPLDKGIDLDLKGNRVSVGRLDNFNGKIEKDYVKGSLNGGGTLVSMRTSGGSVTLN